ncbi:hypothetical protein HPB52_004342 [Rhipicephalus sanguineus]|uniref:Uncharacterized protein n=1 Tax=Rhipicephalus sanguineus TaxID=34632 RepID=A0A9D4PYA7_RHISA|nr:hypothetical protein HPB52_004342 [Rhipicephalus sanguineus]
MSAAKGRGGTIIYLSRVSLVSRSSHIRLFHRRNQSREQRLLAIQQAATAASRGQHLSRDMKALLTNLSPAERRLVAIKNNLQVTPGHAVPFRRVRSQSVMFQVDPSRRSPVRARSLSVSDFGERSRLQHFGAAERLTAHEEDDRFRTYTRQVYVLFAVLAAVVAAVACYTFQRIRHRRDQQPHDATQQLDL